MKNSMKMMLTAGLLLACTLSSAQPFGAELSAGKPVPLSGAVFLFAAAAAYGVKRLKK